MRVKGGVRLQIPLNPYMVFIILLPQKNSEGCAFHQSSVSTYNQNLASNQTKSDGSEPIFEYHVCNLEQGVTYKIPSRAVVSLLLKHMIKIITKLL